MNQERRVQLRAMHQRWLDKDIVFVSAGQRADSITIVQLLDELEDMLLLHHRTVALVFPGERDSPGAYRKLLADAEHERDTALATIDELVKNCSEHDDREEVLRSALERIKKESESSAFLSDETLELVHHTLKIV